MSPWVLISTPTFEGRPGIEYVVSLTQTIQALDVAGIKWSMSLQQGDPYLAKVRNRLASQFLTEFPGATDLFFIDDDVGWPAAKVVDFLRRPEDIVFGCYPRKKDELEFPVSLEMTDDGKRFVEHDGLYAAELVPTGFMRIRRHVIERMAQLVPRYIENDGAGRDLVQWSLFEARYVDPVLESLRKADLSALSREDLLLHLRRAVGQTVSLDAPQPARWWGEDFWFVHRWREMGGTAWCDPDIAFTHSGRKKWAANMMDSLRNVKAQLEAKAA